MGGANLTRAAGRDPAWRCAATGEPATWSRPTSRGADLTGASLFCANLIDSDLTAATLI